MIRINNSFPLALILILHLLATSACSQVVLLPTVSAGVPLRDIVKYAALDYLNDSHSRGISVGVYFKGKKYIYTYGHERAHKGKPPTPYEYVNIGSVAKTFAGILLAKAVIEKKVRLRDDIRMYLPGDYPNLPYRGTPIRIVDLANHTSGLPANFHHFPIAIADSVKQLSFRDQVHFYSIFKQDSLYKDLHYVEPDTIPGTAYRYNSNAIMLLITILERIYHTSYQKLAAKYLRSLGMYHTLPEIPSSWFYKVEQGYDKERPMPYANLSGYLTGPSMNSTLLDMVRYMEVNLKEVDPAIRLSHELTWGKKDGFGVGLAWMLDSEHDGDRYIYHDGNTKLGFNTLLILYPKDQLGIVAIVNETNSLERLGQAVNKIRLGMMEQ